LTRFFKIALVAFVLSLSGCAATVQRQGTTSTDVAPLGAPGKSVIYQIQGGGKQVESSADWERLRAVWRAALTSATSARGVVPTYWELEPESQSALGTLVVIRVNSFRYVSTGARIGLGVFTGNASIDAEASFYEVPSRKLLGKRRYNTSSSAWQGILAPMTSKQVEAISNEIAKELAL
jgi:hypothetical protein